MLTCAPVGLVGCEFVGLVGCEFVRDPDLDIGRCWTDSRQINTVVVELQSNRKTVTLQGLQLHNITCARASFIQHRCAINLVNGFELEGERTCYKESEKKIVSRNMPPISFYTSLICLHSVYTSQKHYFDKRRPFPWERLGSWLRAAWALPNTREPEHREVKIKGDSQEYQTCWFKPFWRWVGLGTGDIPIDRIMSTKIYTSINKHPTRQ